MMAMITVIAAAGVLAMVLVAATVAEVAMMFANGDDAYHSLLA